MEETEKPKEKPKEAGINLLSLTAWILIVCFSVSFATLMFYLTDADHSDDTLYFLLAVLRYSSFFVFVCALYKLFLNFYRIFKKKKRVHLFKMAGYLLLAVYGLFVFFLEAVIVVISGGNA
ncbi:MAG: hypothetical protein FWC01_04590 [Treponema sp.]|nr:hypothetical protein [Treponema sp.]MCL2237736.1 hypothetical protein [Treponema sp.]